MWLIRRSGGAAGAATAAAPGAAVAWEEALTGAGGRGSGGNREGNGASFGPTSCPCTRRLGFAGAATACTAGAAEPHRPLLLSFTKGRKEPLFDAYESIAWTWYPPLRWPRCTRTVLAALARHGNAAHPSVDRVPHATLLRCSIVSVQYKVVVCATVCWSSTQLRSSAQVGSR
jgi:hypothetical protein